MEETSKIPDLFDEDIKSTKINSKKVLNSLVDNLSMISKYLIDKNDSSFKEIEKYLEKISKNLKDSTKFLIKLDYKKLTNAFANIINIMIKMFKLLPIEHELRESLNDLYTYITVYYKLTAKISKKVYKANLIMSHLKTTIPEHKQAKEELNKLLIALKSTKINKVSLKSVEVGKNANNVDTNKMLKSNILKSYKQKEIEALDKKLAEVGNLLSTDNVNNIEIKMLKRKEQLKRKAGNNTLEVIRSKFSTEQPEEFKIQFMGLFKSKLNNKAFINFVNSISNEECEIIAEFIKNINTSKIDIKEEYEKFKTMIEEIRDEILTDKERNQDIDDEWLEENLNLEKQNVAPIEISKELRDRIKKILDSPTAKAVSVLSEEIPEQFFKENKKLYYINKCINLCTRCV